jgi:hypothetical protein
MGRCDSRTLEKHMCIANVSESILPCMASPVTQLGFGHFPVLVMVNEHSMAFSHFYSWPSTHVLPWVGPQVPISTKSPSFKLTVYLLAFWAGSQFAKCWQGHGCISPYKYIGSSKDSLSLVPLLRTSLPMQLLLSRKDPRSVGSLSYTQIMFFFPIFK